MRPFDRVRSLVIPMPQGDVNTDEIIPARFMSKPRVDYGRYFFHDRRFAEDGSVHASFVLNQPQYRGAEILLAGPNFGCGSSREHAVFALADFGIRVVIAPSLADIFHANCLTNGVLPVTLPEAAVRRLHQELQDAPSARVEVDLCEQVVVFPRGERVPFEIDSFRKLGLLRGLDDLERTLEFMADIERYEAQREHLSES